MVAHAGSASSAHYAVTMEVINAGGVNSRYVLPGGISVEVNGSTGNLVAAQRATVGAIVKEEGYPSQLPNSPLAMPVILTYSADQTDGIGLDAILSAASNPDGGPLILTVESPTPSGARAILQGQQLLYLPTSAYANQDTIYYSLTDAWGTSAQGTLNLTIETNAAKDVPVAPSLIWIAVGLFLAVTGLSRHPAITK